MKLTGFDVYRLYVALKTHFHSDTYDYFEREGRVRATLSSYQRRRDRYFFDKLAKRFSGRDSFELIDFFVANLTANSGTWVGEMLTDDCERIYIQWCKRTQALDYTFECDCDTLLNEIGKLEIPFNKLFVIENEQHPLLLRMMMRGQIKVESFIILDNMLNFFGRWDEQMPDDFVWEEFRRKCQKYHRFLPQIDDSKRKHRMIMRARLQDHGLLT